jgi:hypothetical protein
MGKRNTLILGNLMVKVKEIMAELEGVYCIYNDISND